MAWLPLEGAENNRGWQVWTETLTTVQDSATDIDSSVLEFLPFGRDFYVKVVADDLSVSCGIAVKISDKKAGTFSTLVANFINEVDDSTTIKAYDVSANGEAPFYKLSLDNGGAQSGGDSVVLTVWSPSKDLLYTRD